jgi:hypothetical protein
MPLPAESFAQIHALLDQICASLGASQSPELTWVYILSAGLVRLERLSLPGAPHISSVAHNALRLRSQILSNSLCYTLLLHFLYALVIPRLTVAKFGQVPAIIERIFANSVSDNK